MRNQSTVYAYMAGGRLSTEDIAAIVAAH